MLQCIFCDRINYWEALTNDLAVEHSLDVQVGVEQGWGEKIQVS